MPRKPNGFATFLLLGSLCLLAACSGPSSCQRSKPGGGGGSSAATDAGGEVLPVVQKATRSTLQSFASEAELTGFIKELAEAQKREVSRRAEAKSGGGPGSPPPVAAPAPAAAAEQATDSVASSDSESVTNVQHAGVDEGGIVKVHGEHLVVLRRGRLFTVRIGGDALAPISHVDAFGPDVDPAGAWYDEMLVWGDTVVVVGYSYQRGGTEIAQFDLDRDGRLTYRATHHLRSNDYYSSRNYASRLLGSKLVFYSPLYVNLHHPDPMQSFPAMRRWHKGVQPADFRRIVEPTRVYRPLISSPSIALHTVSVCDLAARELDCKATAVMGPPGRVFYVSPSAVYVWMTHWVHRGPEPDLRSIVYRLPLDGSDPTAARVKGSPIDQLSFLESADQHLNVVVRADAAGDAMWRAEVTQGDVALLRFPLSSFDGEGTEIASSHYAGLPRPTGYVFQNRFVGSTLLYGSGSGWGRPQAGEAGAVYAYRYAGGSEPVTVPLRHGVDRIEALGNDAIVVGTDGRDLHFTPIALGGRASAAEPYVRRGASQGELRTHGFFYKPEGATSGTLGLPVRDPGQPGAAHLTQGSASILFLRNDLLRLSELGALGSRPETGQNDGCRASCVDWYGNARPLFLRGRVFALLGYELVEGELAAGRIAERRRVSFAPGALQIVR